MRRAAEDALKNKVDWVSVICMDLTWLGKTGMSHDECVGFTLYMSSKG
jgi:hypothetical protein